jgi:hypothetical protein
LPLCPRLFILLKIKSTYEDLPPVPARPFGYSASDSRVESTPSPTSLSPGHDLPPILLVFVILCVFYFHSKMDELRRVLFF